MKHCFFVYIVVLEVLMCLKTVNTDQEISENDDDVKKPESNWTTSVKVKSVTHEVKRLRPKKIDTEITDTQTNNYKNKTPEIKPMGLKDKDEVVYVQDHEIKNETSEDRSTSFQYSDKIILNSEKNNKTSAVKTKNHEAKSSILENEKNNISITAHDYNNKTNAPENKNESYRVYTTTFEFEYKHHTSDIESHEPINVTRKVITQTHDLKDEQKPDLKQQHVPKNVELVKIEDKTRVYDGNYREVNNTVPNVKGNTVREGINKPIFRSIDEIEKNKDELTKIKKKDETQKLKVTHTKPNIEDVSRGAINNITTTPIENKFVRSDSSENKKNNRDENAKSDQNNHRASLLKNNNVNSSFLIGKVNDHESESRVVNKPKNVDNEGYIIMESAGDDDDQNYEERRSSLDKNNKSLNGNSKQLDTKKETQHLNFDIPKSENRSDGIYSTYFENKDEAGTIKIALDIKNDTIMVNDKIQNYEDQPRRVNKTNYSNNESYVAMRAVDDDDDYEDHYQNKETKKTPSHNNKKALQENEKLLNPEIEAQLANNESLENKNETRILNKASVQYNKSIRKGMKNSRKDRDDIKVDADAAYNMYKSEYASFGNLKRHSKSREPKTKTTSEMIIWSTSDHNYISAKDLSYEIKMPRLRHTLQARYRQLDSEELKNKSSHDEDGNKKVHRHKSKKNRNLLKYQKNSKLSVDKNKGTTVLKNKKDGKHDRKKINFPAEVTENNSYESIFGFSGIRKFYKPSNMAKEISRRQQDIWSWDTFCQLQYKKGNCSQDIVKFYYNLETDKCEEFMYSGCLGNSNSFSLKEDCEKHCKGAAFAHKRKAKSKIFCSFQPAEGTCLAFFTKYYYNIRSHKCEEFVYGGCGGNQNNFDDPDECMERCSGVEQFY